MMMSWKEPQRRDWQEAIIEGITGKVRLTPPQAGREVLSLLVHFSDVLYISDLTAAPERR